MNASSDFAVHRTRANWLACCATLAGLLSLTGCTRMQVKLGWKVYLAQTPMTSIDVNLPKGPAIAPGQKSPLVVSVKEPNGKVLLTQGQGGGKVLWQDLQVTATVVTVNKKGTISLAKDPRVSDGKTGHVTITVPSHPELRADLDIPFRYDIAFKANFSGAQGSSGMNGMDGTDGSSGSTGSTDPNNPAAGGNGGNGTDGSNGGDGGRGSDASPVQIRVAYQAPTAFSSGHPLMQISVSSGAVERFFLVDPQGGSLTVRADGGAGGSGGRGGRGGRGGSGGIGSPSGSDGMSGHDGLSGSDGSPGSGGLITVTYDPNVGQYMNAIHLSSWNGPKPAFLEEPVAALW